VTEFIIDLQAMNTGKEYPLSEQLHKLKGANMDIDLATPHGQILWEQDRCPWNQAERTDEHRCALKNISLCQYFRGVEYLDTLLCCYQGINEPCEG
jgi:hypothetical protein